MDLKQFRETYQRIVEEIQKVVIGQDEVVHLLLTSVLAEGHVILTGVPGLGRTLIAETLGKVLGLKINRIQFTPDLLPTDVTGAQVIETIDGEHRYHYVPGPIFANMILADEINRSPARTQSSLLEAMQEKQVTASGKRYPLDRPFLVVATQNTLDTEGVYSLPEAQLDRFMMQIEIRYPTEDAECAIIDATTSVAHATVSNVVDAEMVIAMQTFAKVIPVTMTMKQFAARLVRGSRWEEEKKKDEAEDKMRGNGDSAAEGKRGGLIGLAKSVRDGLAELNKGKRYWWGGLKKTETIERIAQFVRWGASPRAGQCLLRAAKVRAIVKGRAYVTREDIIDVFGPILAHRVIPDHRAGAKGLTSRDVLERLVQEVIEATAPVPVSARMKSLLMQAK